MTSEMQQKLCSQEAADSLGKETAGAYAQIWGRGCKLWQPSVTGWLLVMGLFHHTKERWLSVTPENQHHEALWRVLLCYPCIQMLQVLLIYTQVLLHSERCPHILLVPWELVVVKQDSGGKSVAGGVVYNSLLRSYVWMNGLPGTPLPVLLVHAFRLLLPGTACKYLF